MDRHVVFITILLSALLRAASDQGKFYVDGTTGLAEVQAHDGELDRTRPRRVQSHRRHRQHHHYRDDSAHDNGRVSNAHLLVLMILCGAVVFRRVRQCCYAQLRFPNGWCGTPYLVTWCTFGILVARDYCHRCVNRFPTNMSGYHSSIGERPSRLY